MMIATRYDIIELSRASDGDYQLRINTDRWVPVDRPMLVAIHQAAWHLLGQQQAGRQTIKGRYPTDTVTLAYGAPDGYALRIGTGRPVFLDRPHLQALHDEVAQLLQHGESQRPKQMDDYDDNERLRQEVRRLKAQVFALEEEKEDPAPPVPVRLPGTGEDAREAAAVVDPHVVSEPS